MAQNYTRQSSFSDGDTITASLFNNEYNQLVNAFTYSSTDADATGHRHDGTSGQGGNIYRIGDLNFLNKIEIDGSNNRLGFYVEVSSTAVEQIRIQDGVILPVTTNDIDLGSVTLQFKDGYFDGTINSDSLVLSSGSTVTAILDEDNLVSDSATALATQQSIKAYVDAQVTAQDLDLQGDTGGALSIDLNSETLTIAGGTGIDTAGATNTLTVSIDNTVTTLTGTQVLTNKTINADNNTVSNLEVDNLKTGVLDTDISAVAVTHTTLPSALAVKTYVDALVTAQDLDIVGDTGTDAIDLDSETLTFTGGTGITSVVTAGTVTHNIDSTVATLTDTQTLTNKTLTSPDINGGTIDNAIIGGTTAAAGSFTNITVSGSVDGRDVAADGSKLDGIEALADVTDTANVTAAGALMDSELTNITAVKALNQGVATTDSPSFAGLTATTADINAGTIDDTVIGGTTAAAGTFTTGQFDTSVNVDGTVTAEGLLFNNEGETITLKTSGAPQGRIKTGDSAGTNSLQIEADNAIILNSGQDDTAGSVDHTAITRGSAYTRTALFDHTGDISFYEDTGTTAKLYWDASAETLDVGDTTFAAGKFRVFDNAGNHLWLKGRSSDSTSSVSFRNNADSSYLARIEVDDSNGMKFQVGSSERVRIDSSGNVGIGTSSPDTNIATGLDIANFIVGRYDLSGGVPSTSLGGIFSANANGGGFSSGDLVLQSRPEVNARSIIFYTGNTTTERMRIDSSGHLIVPEGITLGTAAGTYNAANTLDDYEEGTWTPVLSDGTNNATASIAVGTYTKIGRMVHVKGSLFITSLGSVAGALLFINGLPFTTSGTANTSASANFGYGEGLNLPAGTSLAGYLNTGNTRIVVQSWDAVAGTTNTTAAEWSADGSVYFDATYYT